jgi:hypothetical protein
MADRLANEDLAAGMAAHRRLKLDSDAADQPFRRTDDEELVVDGRLGN